MKHCINKYLITLTLFIALPQPLMAAPLWSDVPAASKTAVDISGLFIQQKQSNINPHVNSRRVSVDYNSLKSTLAAATSVSAGQAKNKLSIAQIDLPMPYGGLQTFNVYPTVVMEAGLAAKYPQIKTYKVIAESDQTITGVLDTGSKGFHAYLHTAEGDVFIDPIPTAAQQEYYSYYKRDYASITPKSFSCGVEQVSVDESPVTAFKTLARTSGNIITYRIAVAATGEYSQAVKNSPSDSDQQIKDAAMAEIVTAISRINQIYERDIAISLLLVADNDLIVHTDPASDPYSDPSTGLTLINENQTSIDDILTPSGYDVGHVFNTFGGGLAGLGVACIDGYKARGESGLSNPVGDAFSIDIVAHEIGHQLGANHTFNGTTLSCADPNRNAATAFEPGSGSTIMAYAGICGSENVALLSDATFHAGSITEIVSNTRFGYGDTCSGITGVSQLAPTANAGSDYAIPGGTAFALTGQANDPEADAMTFQWDQMDAGVETSSIDYGTDKGSNALFRAFAPTASPERIFPQLTTLLNNTVDKAETLPVKNRTLNFRFTARDGNGGVAEDDMQVSVDANSGPFQILQPNTNVILNSMQQQSIQWNSACSELSPVNCSNVDILYSSDNGASFNSLVGSTPNDGVEAVTFPNTNASNARIKIACANNVFFDISDTSFQLSNSAGSVLPTSVIGGSFNCGTDSTSSGGGGGGGALSAYGLLMLIITALFRFLQTGFNDHRVISLRITRR